MTTDVDSYMFGSILAMNRADVALSVGLSIAVLVLFVMFYHRLFAITFDESFSRATGVKVGRYNTVLSVLTALTIVLGMRMMGAMLISSLIIFPALSAMRVRKSFRGVVITAGILSVVCFCVGLTGLVPVEHPRRRDGRARRSRGVSGVLPDRADVPEIARPYRKETAKRTDGKFFRPPAFFD